MAFLPWLAAKERDVRQWRNENEPDNQEEWPAVRKGDSAFAFAPTSKAFVCAEEENDPFQILLLQPPSDKPRVNRQYVARNVAYVLDLETKEAEKLTKQAWKEGAVVLGTWTMKECSEFEKKLIQLDIMCRSIPAPVGSGVQAGDPAFLLPEEKRGGPDFPEEEEEEDFFLQKPYRARLNSPPPQQVSQKPQRARLNSRSQQAKPLKSLSKQNKMQRSQQNRAAKYESTQKEVQGAHRSRKSKTRHMSTDDAEEAIFMNPMASLPSRHHQPREQMPAKKKASKTLKEDKKTWAEI